MLEKTLRFSIASTMFPTMAWISSTSMQPQESWPLLGKWKLGTSTPSLSGSVLLWWLLQQECKSFLINAQVNWTWGSLCHFLRQEPKKIALGQSEPVKSMFYLKSTGNSNFTSKCMFCLKSTGNSYFAFLCMLFYPSSNLFTDLPSF